MVAKSQATVKAAAQPVLNVDRSGLLQRKCECGNAVGLAGACGGCQSQRLVGIGGGGVQPGAGPVLHDLVQTKLVVGAVGDKYEQEADRVAGEVMRMPDSAVGVQRQSQDLDPEEEEESALRLKPLAETITPLVQRKAAGMFDAQPDLESRLSASKGGGTPLPNDVRSFMEPRFGRDFSQVRVHTGSGSVQINRELGAKAFTHGSHIYYGAGKAPAKDELTGHELAHVVQQTHQINLTQTKSHPNFEIKPQSSSKIAENQIPDIQAQLNLRPSQESPWLDASQSVDEYASPSSYILSIDGSETTLNAEQIHTFFMLLARRMNGRLQNAYETISDYIRRVRLGRQDRQERGLDGGFTQDQGSFLSDFFHESVATISDFMGNTEMPGSEIFDAAQSHFQNTARLIRARSYTSYRQALAYIESFEISYNIGQDRWNHYLEQTQQGAENTIEVLEVAEVAGAIAASVATGGAASAAGYGLVATSATLGLTAASYGATQEFAGQTGELGVGLRGEYDTAAILRRAAIDGVTALVGSLVGGALSNVFKRAFGSYLSSSIGDDVLVELGEQMGLGGPLPRDYFMTSGQRFIADFFGGVGASPLNTAVTALINTATGGNSPESAEAFCEQVVQEMAEGAVMDIFISAVTHSLTGVASRRASTHEAHPPSAVHSGSHASTPHSETLTHQDATSHSPHPAESSTPTTPSPESTGGGTRGPGEPGGPGRPRSDGSSPPDAPEGTRFVRPADLRYGRRGRSPEPGESSARPATTTSPESTGGGSDRPTDRTDRGEAPASAARPNPTRPSAPEPEPATAPSPSAASGSTEAATSPPNHALPPDWDIPNDFEFRPEGPVVRVPTRRSGEPARVGEAGAGPHDTNLGLPPRPDQGSSTETDPSLIDLTRTDVRTRPGVTEWDATLPPPSSLRDLDTLIINNPRYAVDISTVGESVHPGGRIIIQGRAEVMRGMRGVNRDMTRILRQVQEGGVPPGYRVVEVLTDQSIPSGDPTVIPRPSWVMGGPFGRTEGGPVSWPNCRIIIEKAIME